MRAVAHTFFALTVLASTTACARFPKLDDGVDHTVSTAAFPEILPIDALVASVPRDEPDVPQYRVTSQNTKSQATSGQGLTDADRQRLLNATTNP